MGRGGVQGDPISVCRRRPKLISLLFFG